MAKNQVAVPEENALASLYTNVPAFDPKEFGEVAGANEFLPRVSLNTGTSELAKEGKLMAGRYALIANKESFKDLTESVVMIPFTYRAKALLIEGGEGTSYYDMKSPEFQKVKEAARAKVEGNMYGPEFLVWIPGHGWATLFCNNPTMRNEAPKLAALMDAKKACKASIHLIKAKGRSWLGPLFDQYTAPITDLPDDVQEQVTKFLNPPVAAAKEAAPQTDRAR